jgi:hypothetical protein
MGHEPAPRNRSVTDSHSSDCTGTRHFLTIMWEALSGDPIETGKVKFVGCGELPSLFAVSDFAAAAVASAGAAIAKLLGAAFGEPPPVIVDRRLASLWFARSIQPIGWTLPAAWDPLAGDYATTDGWIRLHTNAPRHHAAALAALGVPAVRDDVERAVARWNAVALESAVVESGGCAAAMRTVDAWTQHSQGQSVFAEPLVALRDTDDADATPWQPTRDRPLQGLRVLDLTRVLAGPIATRFLAGFGAQVLRIDPPVWDEPAIVPDVTLGKRCARLDLHDTAARETFHRLLSDAHVLVHGYRAGALDALGFDPEARRRIRPGLVDVSLNAYGWSGPWSNRRGFDSLVQMSSGIADAGMRRLGRRRPTPLPVQALDHATGYLMAAAVIQGLTRRLSSGRGFEAKASLARTAQMLIGGPDGDPVASMAPAEGGDYSSEVEHTAFGAAHRLKPAIEIDAAPMRWDLPATTLGSTRAEWA